MVIVEVVVVGTGKVKKTRFIPAFMNDIQRLPHALYYDDPGAGVVPYCI